VGSRGARVIALAIRRPVAVLMVYLALALLGVVAWVRIPRELLPDTELPRLTVTAWWPGASPEMTEALLTSPVEAVVRQVRGVRRVTSTSEERFGAGVARIDVAFARATRMNFARLELSEALAALARELPPGVSGPRVEQYVPPELAAGARLFLTYTVTASLDGEALRGYVDGVIAPAVRQVAGVGDVVVGGKRARVVEVRVGDAMASALRVTPNLVRQAVLEPDLVRDAGSLRLGGVLAAVTVRAPARTVVDVGRLPVGGASGRRLLVRDVATVRDGIGRPTSHYRVNGEPAVTLTIAREPGADAVDVADAVKSVLGKIAASSAAPNGLRFLLDADESAAVRAQLGDLGARAALSAVAVLAVLLVALRSARLAIAVLGAGAVATLVTVNALFAAGYTLNALTLLGLAMGVSLTVDGAIVVTENIVRRHRLGDPPARAAALGAREVAVAAAASSATSLVVLLPFVYLQGELRAYYVPLAVAVGVSHAVGLLVSLTLLPVIAARALGGGRTHPVFARGWSRPYRRLLTSSLRRPWLVLAPAALVAGGSCWLFVTVVHARTDWRPWAPPDRALVVTIALPYGEELEQADALARRVERWLGGEPGVVRVVSSVHPRFAVVRVTLADSLQPSPAAHRVRDRLVAFANELGGAEVRVSGLATAGGTDAISPPTYALAVLGYDYETVRAIAEGIGARLRLERRVRDLDVNATSAWHLRDRATEIVLRLDRDGIARHGLTARDVVAHVIAATGAEAARREVTLGGAAVHIAVGVQGGGELDVRALERSLVPAGASAVRLGAVARIEERETLSRIVREEQRYQRLVTYEFLGTPTLGDRLRDGVVGSTRLPKGYAIRADGGEARDDARLQLWGVVAVAVALVYLVTAAMFESLRQPLCVLLTVPMALAGVALLFACTGAPFTREAHAGVVVMVGIVANAAILLVYRINQLRGAAHSGGAAVLPAPTLAAAVVRGTLDRARPILMTGAAAVAGFLPLAAGGDGAGPSIWSGLSYALIGGLASSTLFVLTATPALYLLVERARWRPRRPGHGGRGGSGAG